MLGRAGLCTTVSRSTGCWRLASRLRLSATTSVARAAVPLALGASLTTASASNAAGTSLHSFTAKTIGGSALSMSDLAGKPVLMLNVASR